MLNIKIFKDYLPNFSSILQRLRSYRHFKIHAYICLEGRIEAEEMLLILKLKVILGSCTLTKDKCKVVSMDD